MVEIAPGYYNSANCDAGNKTKSKPDSSEAGIIKGSMPFDPNTLTRPFRKLRKSLKNGLVQSSAEEVHDIRTQSRRIEATMRALGLDKNRDAQSLSKAIAQIRRRAGKVRDMDVLTAFASAMTCDGENDCIVELLTYLGAKRFRFAAKLENAASKRQNKALHGLKRFSDLIEGRFSAPETRGQEICEWRADATAAVRALSSDLAAWPEPAVGNLHAFRILVKELINVLRLADEPESEVLDALGEVKNTIGEWHDWNELKKFAAKVLRHGRSCGLRTKIDSIVKQKLERAVLAASQLKQRFVKTSANTERKRENGLLEPVAGHREF